ncbi:hypothetical protein [Catellatospora chokoriensis]|uniref:Uncharacterized protein n=1 Tax=Catellatospora chokoriensis TaxID=310353 RepID=A0A8J3JUP1_9ACTN|nr:hypothetical protein [Catellatospora chokoriensis]GIF91397.1 hypothetical protein Cch02nite_48410 [Catellatospora chokoriensis]
MASRGIQRGDVAVMGLPDGGFGACQVTAVDKDLVSAYPLRWHSSTPPTLDDLRGVEPLILDHHAHGGRIAHLNIGSWHAIPPGFRWIGALPVPPDVSDRSDVYSGWQALGADVVHQHRWDHQLPPPAKAAYRAGARGHVNIDFGGGRVWLAGVTGQLDLTDNGPVEMPASGAVDWAALDELPRCTALTWGGPDRGLCSALADHPMISSLAWRDAPHVVDVSETGLTHLSLAGDVREVRLPRGLLHLDLDALGPDTTVTAVDDGHWLSLTVTDAKTLVGLPAGLGRVRDVTVIAGGVASAAVVAHLAELEMLRIRWRRPPGQLTDASVLARLNRLAVVELIDGYGLDADTLPDLPSLTHAAFSGVRRSIVAAVKSRFRKTPVRLIVDGAKGDTWLAVNLNNPFRDWVDDHARGGAAACKAYAVASRAVDKLTQGDRMPGEAEPVLQTLIKALNDLDHKHSLVDTLRREQAYDAFRELADRAGVAADTADEWFDDWRDF